MEKSADKESENKAGTEKPVNSVTESAAKAELEKSKNCPDGACGSCQACTDFESWKADLLENRRKDRASLLVVDKRTATADYFSFADEQRINTSIEEFSEEEKEVYDEAERRIIKAIMSGEMKVNEDNELVFMPKSGKKEIVFKKPKGRSLMALDRVKKNQEMKAYMEVMTDMTNVNKANEFTSLDEVDVKTCKMVIQLFLGS